MSYYQRHIREELARIGRVGAADPRHVEGYMRLASGTLDHLSPAQFRAEVEFAMECVDLDGATVAEDLAQSFGL